MKNYEKYADEIRECKGKNFCRSFIKPHILKTDNCSDTSCSTCQMLQMLWLLEEYEEPEVDWGKVEVDTPILVRNTEDEEWRKRYFAKYDKYGFVYTWKSGRTSWTEEDLCVWSYAKLIEDKEDYKEPEVDWSKVKVDTPILVRHSEKAEWIRRYFAKYENGIVYAWGSGLTSWTTHGMTTAWQFAKLPEDEGDK